MSEFGKGDLLRGLDDVPWRELKHAFGSAADVPGLLRNLMSGDAQVRRSAFDELVITVWHQGTVYEATPHALPFLMRFLHEEEEYPDRVWVVLLVAGIINGSGYYEVHAPQREGGEPGEFDGEIERERRIVAEVRRIGAAALPVLKEYLGHEEPEVRGTVAEALACYPARRLEHEALLQRALSVETEDEARERIRESLDRLQSRA